VRRAPGTRVQRRAEAYEEALLHQFRVHKLPPGGRGEKVYVKPAEARLLHSTI